MEFSRFGPLFRIDASIPENSFIICAAAIGDGTEINMKFNALCENHLFMKAYSKGKRAVTSALALYVLPDYQAKKLANAHPEKRVTNRIGLTTSTKLGGAVVRSRCRRVMREALSALMKEKTVKVGFIIVIAARSAMTELKSSEVKRQLNFALTKLGMYENL